MLEIAALALSYARTLVGTARFERATTAIRTRDAARLHHVPWKKYGAGLAMMAGPAPRRLRSADTYTILRKYAGTDRCQRQRQAESIRFGTSIRRRYVVHLLHIPGHTIFLLCHRGNRLLAANSI